MKKKQVLYIAIALIFAVLIMPQTVGAKGNKEVLTCNYEYNESMLTYKVYSDGKIELPFEDGKKENDKEWYHGYEFDSIFLSSIKNSTKTDICPTITIEESDTYYTVFNNPRTEEDCNGVCKTISAQNGVKDTIVLNSVGIYEDTRYFIPYFRVLSDGTKEWSVNGKDFAGIEKAVKVQADDKVIEISLSKDLINSLFTETTQINRCVNSDESYTLTTDLKYCKNKELSTKDNQLTSATSYHGSLGDKTTQEDLNSWFEGDDVKSCGKGGILGDPKDPDSVAWLLQKLLNYLRAIGPMIVIVTSGIEFTKVIITSDDDGMKKAQKKLITRLILIAALFFVPTLVIALLDIFGMNNDPTCGLE